MASNVIFDRHATASWEERPDAQNVVREANRRDTHAWVIVGSGLLLVVLTLSYLNIQLSIGNGFRYASALRIAFLLMCLAFVAGAIAGLTQLSKR
jgi:hypothetical protein